ncbi:MAG: DNA repair protein RecN [Ruminococcaceae bacterium]|nr:DNA repair protein RecN [Oscillospiraceae bacterium]
MLHSLYIENIAVARRISLDFERGFTVMTGETGAGKSVMIDCLALITGGKSQREMIRSGEERAMVSAVFSDIPVYPPLAEAGISPDENGDLEIIRTFTADGRSSVKINRRTVPLTLLREIGPYLVSIQSQSEARNLLDKSFHLDMLDEYAGTAELLADYAVPYASLNELTSAAQSLRESLREKNMLTDILKYQIKEIDAAKLNDPDEEEKLIASRTKIKDIERIAKYSNFVYRALAQSEKGASASVLLQKSAAALRQLADVMPEAEQMAARLDNYRYELEDIGESARALTDDSDVDNPEQQLNAIEARLSLMERLKRKYGTTLAEIRQFRNDAAARLADLESGDEKLSEIEHEIGKIRKVLSEKAAEISRRRQNAAEELNRAVSETLAYLDMPKVRFLTDVHTVYASGAEQFGPRGSDDVTFMIATNPGEPPMPLGKIASGGEMSRVMLALRSVLNTQSGAATVVFDEIDAGVSGGTSEKIGLKLKEISACTQVLCVTHSPQIASLADHHLRIRKTEHDGRAESEITELDADGRVAEIARIIGGIDVTETQREAAREMIEKQ